MRKIRTLLMKIIAAIGAVFGRSKAPPERNDLRRDLGLPEQDADKEWRRHW